MNRRLVLLPLALVLAGTSACGKSEPRACEVVPSSVVMGLEDAVDPQVDMTDDTFKWTLLNIWFRSADKAPNQIQPAIKTVRDAIEQRWQRGVRLTDDEQVRAAAEQIDQWTRDHCPPKDTSGGS
ncbi:MAG: hypothetical protein N2037_09370 [Acidimicrobiales bacterium]|nr:hypothetical protein [Acidimicrobiales bacterium]